MTKYRIYIRINDKGTVTAGKRPKFKPLPDNSYSKPRPTILIALDLDIPKEQFEATRILLEKKIEKSQPAIEITEMNEEKSHDKI